MHHHLGRKPILYRNSVRSLGRACDVARASSLRDGIRFAWHARKCGSFRDAWLPFLNQLAARHGLPEPDADVLMKPLRPYAALHLSVNERLALLQTHYEIALEHASLQLIRAIWNGGCFEAGTIHGRTGAYRLVLCSTSAVKTRKEGEITVALREAQTAQDLAKLTFLFAEDASGHRRLMIGGVQGYRSPSAKDMIVAATRDLFGLRPRDAILIAALAIARNIGAEEAWAVSSEFHVHNARSRKQRERMHFDYDAYWTERGALRDGEKGWRLKVPFAPPHTGKTSNGSRRDAVKDAIWTIAQQEFGPATAEVAAPVSRIAALVD